MSGQDTAGSERYEAMSRIYYRGARAAVVCYGQSRSVFTNTLRPPNHYIPRAGASLLFITRGLLISGFAVLSDRKPLTSSVEARFMQNKAFSIENNTDKA